jgi:RNA ligase (TIGR02306 family)
MKINRKLASIRKISEIIEIPDANSIELAIVDGWSVVVAKDQNHFVGELVVYCEIDSFLPIREEFEFLRKSSYTKMLDQEGFRLRSIKLKGQISQGLLLKLEILNSKTDPEMVVGISKQPWGEQFQLGPYDNALLLESGVDVTNLLDIIKYDKPIPANLQGLVKGQFPSFLSKTDEERVQNLKDDYIDWRKNHFDFYITEKLDGSSATFYINNGEFGVCSRNLDLLESEDNTYWKVAREMDIGTKLRSLNVNVAIQGELIGEGIQGNPYKIKGQTVKFFSGFDIDKRSKMNYSELALMIARMNFDMVPVLSFISGSFLPETIEDLLKYAEGKSELNDKFEREGVVIRSTDSVISFKAISNKFLLKQKD